LSFLSKHENNAIIGLYLKLQQTSAPSGEYLYKISKIRTYSDSRSSKVIDLGVNRKPMYDFYSLIVTLAVSATVFEILTLKARKSLNFCDLPFFEAPVRGDPLEFGDEIWRQKTRVLGLPEGEEIMPLAFFVLTQYRRVTDRRTDTLRSLLPA